MDRVGDTRGKINYTQIMSYMQRYADIWQYSTLCDYGKELTLIHICMFGNTYEHNWQYMNMVATLIPGHRGDVLPALRSILR